MADAVFQGQLDGGGAGEEEAQLVGGEGSEVQQITTEKPALRIQMELSFQV